MEGKRVATILHGKETKVRDALYTGYRICPRSVRDDRWKRIRYPLVDETRLFDFKNDPMSRAVSMAGPNTPPRKRN